MALCGTLLMQVQVVECQDVVRGSHKHEGFDNLLPVCAIEHTRVDDISTLHLPCLCRWITSLCDGLMFALGSLSKRNLSEGTPDSLFVCRQADNMVSCQVITISKIQKGERDSHTLIVHIVHIVQANHTRP